jgi:hypothetical protein
MYVLHCNFVSALSSITLKLYILHVCPCFVSDFCCMSKVSLFTVIIPLCYLESKRMKSHKQKILSGVYCWLFFYCPTSH